LIIDGCKFYIYIYKYIYIYINTDQKEDGTLDDRRRDGGTNSTLRIKEQGMHLTLNEHDDDDIYIEGAKNDDTLTLAKHFC